VGRQFLFGDAQEEFYPNDFDLDCDLDLDLDLNLNLNLNVDLQERGYFQMGGRLRDNVGPSVSIRIRRKNTYGLGSAMSFWCRVVP